MMEDLEFRIESEDQRGGWTSGTCSVSFLPTEVAATKGTKVSRHRWQQKVHAKMGEILDLCNQGCNFYFLRE